MFFPGGRSIGPLLAALAVAASACGGEAHRTIEGTFTLIDDTRDLGSAPFEGSSCQGSGGYADIAAGMDVVISSKGKTLAVARFSPGRFSKFAGATGHCLFNFTLKDVPGGRDFYEVKVGRRGTKTYTWDELTTPGQLAYEIGR